MIRYYKVYTIGVILLTTLLFIVLLKPVLAQSAAHEQAITTAYRDWVDAANAKDIKQWSTFLAPDALFLPPNRPALSSFKSITDFYTNLFTDEHLFLDCQQDTVEIARAEDMAWATGHCKITFTSSEGQVKKDKSKWVKVWKRQPNGEWKCRINSWSSTEAE